MRGLMIGQRVQVDDRHSLDDGRTGHVVNTYFFTLGGRRVYIRFVDGDYGWFDPAYLKPIYSGTEVVAAQVRIHADMPLALVGDHPYTPSPWITVEVDGVAIDAEATFYRLMAGVKV